jgi:TP901 family phage tail tape measure protein
MVAGSQGFDLGNAHGKIILDTSQMQAGLQRAQQQMDNGFRRMGQGMQRMGASVSNFGASMTVATAPVLAFGVQGVMAAARFEDALVEVQARASLTEDQMEAVRAKALEIGRDTQFSAGQGAEAFLQLITSGQSVEEAMVTIGSVMEGAAAAGTDLGFTADALTDIMAQFNTQGTTAEEVVNALTKASGSSSATFADLAQGFQNGGAEAAGFGISIDDTAAILATFSENGIKGAEAGTKLKSMLQGMTRQTADVQETWARLGLSMFDATGQARPLGAVMQDLRGALSGMTQEAQIETIQSLAGSYGAAGLRALVFGDTLEDMRASMENAATAGEVAEARMSTFTGSLLFLKGSLETFQIQVLTPLMENVLKPIVLAFADIVNQVTEWVKVNPELANQIVRVITAILALGPSLFVAGKLISLIGTVIALLASPIGIVILAIAALVAAYQTNFMGIADIVDALWSLISVTFQRMITVFGEEGLMGALRHLFFTFEDGSSFVGAFLTILGLGEGTAFAIADAFNTLALFVINNVIPALVSLGNWFLTDVLPLVVAYITDIFIPLLLDMANFLIDLWRIVEPHLVALADWFLVTALPAIFSWVQDHIFPLLEEFVRLIGNLWDVVGPKLLQFADWFLVTALPRVIGYLDGPVTAAFNAIISVITTIVDAITKGLDLINRFIESGQNLGDIIPDLTPNISGLSSFDPRKLFGTGGIVTQPTPAIIGDNVPPGSFEAVLQEPQLRALLQEVKGGGGGGDIIINAEPGTLNIGQDPATQGMILAEALERRLQQAGIR